jgi:transcription elongation GreA/GreB family factor
MTWWPPWRRASDDAARNEVAESERRLRESEELLRRANEVERRMHRHLRRNRFGAMVDKEVYGGQS